MPVGCLARVDADGCLRVPRCLAGHNTICCAGNGVLAGLVQACCRPNGRDRVRVQGEGAWVVSIRRTAGLSTLLSGAATLLLMRWHVFCFELGLWLQLGLEWGDKKSICNRFPQPSSVTTLSWPVTRPFEVGTCFARRAHNRLIPSPTRCHVTAR